MEHKTIYFKDSLNTSRRINYERKRDMISNLSTEYDRPLFEDLKVEKKPKLRKLIISLIPWKIIEAGQT